MVSKPLRATIHAVLAALALAMLPAGLRGDSAADARAEYQRVYARYKEQRQAKHYAEAEKTAIELGRLAAGPLSDQPEMLADALCHQAHAVYHQQRYAEAERLYLRELTIRERAPKPDRAKIAETLYSLALAYHAEGRYAQAESPLKRSLATRDKLLGPDHLKVAATAHTLARIETLLGHLSAAEPLYRRALAIREKALGPNHADVAESLNGLAFVLYQQVRYAEAEPLYQRALAILEKAVGPEHHSVAMIHNDLGLLYKDQSRWAEAESRYQRALAIREKSLPAASPLIAQSLANLARLYQAQARYAEAEPLLKRALAIQEQSRSPGHPSLAGSLGDLADLYRAEGRFGEAEALFQRALAIQEKTLGPDHLSVAATLDRLALTCGAQSRYAEAEPLLRRALAIREKGYGPEHPNVAASLNNLALLYREQSRYAEAEPLLRRAVALFEKGLGPEHPNSCCATNTLAEIEVGLGRYPEAEQLLTRTLKTREKILAPDHPELATSCRSLAQLYIQQGRRAEAERLLRRALAAFEKSCGPQHPLVAYALTDLAGLYCEQERFAEAESPAERAIDIFEHTHASLQRLLKCYRIRAELGWRGGRRGEAVADLRRAMELAEQLRGQTSGAAHERAEYFGQFSDVFEQMVAWQTVLGDPSEVLQAIERARARSLLDDLNLAGADLSAGRPAAQRRQLQRQEAELKARAADLEQQLSAATAGPQRAQLETLLAQARDALYKHYRDQRSTNPVYRSLLATGAGGLRLSRVQHELAGRDGLLLMYLLGERNGYVLAVGPDAARVSTLDVDEAAAKALGIEAGPLTAARLHAALSRSDDQGVLQQLASPQRAAQATAKLAALWQLLVPEPQRQALTSGKVRRLLVVPDGPLALLPLETLVVRAGDEPQYLLDAGPPLLYGPSATVICNLADRPAAAPLPGRKPVLSVADPAYIAPQADKPASGPARGSVQPGAQVRSFATGAGLTRLPYTAWESAWVAEAFNKHGLAVEQLLQKEATKQKLRAAEAGRRVVHLACHAMADEAYGNFFGGLALTPGPRAATDPADDGFLTLAEICELNLKDCELALLSACETNFGPQQRGEGVWTLSRGFLVAGSRRVVASDWLVDDEAAASTVSYFCALVAAAQQAGQPPDFARALHEAKRWVRGQQKWAKPFYWAPLVLVGPN
jgi:CHAT domain-containing protein